MYNRIEINNIIHFIKNIVWKPYNKVAFPGRWTLTNNKYQIKKKIDYANMDNSL